MTTHKINFEVAMEAPSNPETAEKYDVYYLYLNDTLVCWDLYEKGHSIKYIFKDLFKQYFWRTW